MRDDLFECVCTVCQVIFLNDGGEPVCGDSVCLAIFNQHCEMEYVDMEVGRILDEAYLDVVASQLGL